MSKLLTLALGLTCLALGARLILRDSNQTVSTTPPQETNQPDPKDLIALGRQIYVEGRGKDAMEASLAGSGTVVPASVMPCINCHAENGQGKPEGGIYPSDITWYTLTKPYGARALDGRERGAYSETSLTWAITQGVDPSGNQLDRAMPRYRMSLGDMAALVAYLRSMDTVRDPGVESGALHLGVPLPASAELLEVSRAAEAALKLYFKQANATGGIFGRRLEANFLHASTAAQLRNWNQTQSSFVWLVPLPLDAQVQLAVLCEDLSIPVVRGAAPLAAAESSNSLLFQVLPRLQDQGLALAEYLAEQDAAGCIVLLGAPQVTDPIEQYLRKRGVEQVHATQSAPSSLELADWLQPNTQSGLLVADADPATRLALSVVNASDWRPNVFALGANWCDELQQILHAEQQELVLALPTAPRATQPSPWIERLIDAGAYSEAHHSAQVAALAAAEVLVEGLRRIGQPPTRLGLQRELEGLIDYETKLVPAVTFDANRRIGARGACIVSVEHKTGRLRIAADWVEPVQ